MPLSSVYLFYGQPPEKFHTKRKPSQRLLTRSPFFQFGKGVTFIVRDVCKVCMKLLLRFPLIVLIFSIVVELTSNEIKLSLRVCISFIEHRVAPLALTNQAAALFIYCMVVDEFFQDNLWHYSE